MLKGLTDRDVDVLRRLIRRTGTAAYNTRLLPVEPEHFGPPPTAYVAYAHYGVPGRVGTRLGTADADLYQVVRGPVGTGSASGSGSFTPYDVSELVELYEVGALVCNAQEKGVLPGSWVVVVREQGGSWVIVGSSDSGGRALLLVQAGDPFQTEPLDGCTGTGTGCGMLFHAAEVLAPDPECQDYVLTGECVWVADVLGRRLESNRPYWADFIGSPPEVLHNVIVTIDPDDPDLCIPDNDSPVYSVDIGTPARTVTVEERVGRLCATTGSGTDSQDLVVYRGTVYIWSSTACTYIKHEDCLVANAEGCELPLDRRVTGVMHRMVPKSKLPGTGWVDRCLPLYITTEKDRLRSVGDIVRDGCTLKVYFIDPDGCEDELEFGHDIDLCDCCPQGSGSATAGGACWCDGKTTSMTYTVSTFVLSNGTCLGIPGCPGFGPTFDVTRVGDSCVWLSSTLASPCGGSLGATLTVNSNGSAVLVIGGGTHDVSAEYHTDGPWSCNGSNSMDLVTNGAGCGSWPGTVTVAP